MIENDTLITESYFFNLDQVKSTVASAKNKSPSELIELYEMCVKSGCEEDLLQYVLRDRDATDVFIKFDIGKIASSAFCSKLCIPTFSEAETRLVFRNLKKIRNARSRNMQKNLSKICHAACQM